MTAPAAEPRRSSALQRQLSLGDVLEGPSFHEVVKSFVELYKVGIKVFDDRGAKLADLKTGNGDFCGYVFSFADGRTKCTATVARVKDGPISQTQGAISPNMPSDQMPLGMVIVPCFTGLRYLVMPVLWEGDALGRVVFGPFTPEDLKQFPQSLLDISKGLDLKEAHTHLVKIRRAPEASVARVMLHFAQLLEALVASGQKTYLTSQLHIEATLETNRDLETNNQRLQLLNARLQDLDRLKSSFLATVSHELRTPLTSIIGYSEMLGEGLAGPLNPEQIEYARTITEKGESLLRLITSILDLSQIEAGTVKLNFEPLDLADIAQAALSSVRPQAQKKGVGLEVAVAPFVNKRAVGDRDKLRQIIVNLLGNSVKFTRAGGRVLVQVSAPALQAELRQEGYRIDVEDTGIGIPQDQLERIFQSFYQVDHSSTREFGGAGLGLSIVKSYVEGHGGKVQVRSEVGKGSRFTVVLPLVPPPPKRVAIPAVAAPIADRF
ncbi:MAG: ATP-binding protein [Myxococcaceae bacterium]